jgi:mannosyl-oligosaccharide alpha-1,2-mannosidase
LDSLDTLYLMGLTAEFRRAADWAVANLTFAAPRAVESWDAAVEMHVSLFETNIRAVGGLLAAGSLSGEAALVARAADVAARLLPAFDTDSGVPTNWVQLARGGVRGAQHAILSEFATLSMEFLSTSALTGDPRYAELAEGALLAALRAPGRGSGEERGFMQTLLDPNGGGGFSGGRISFGGAHMRPLVLAQCSASHAAHALAAPGAGDSAYEYFIKTWLLMGRDDAFLPYRHLFDAAADSLAARLTRRSGSRLYIAEQCVVTRLAEAHARSPCCLFDAG